MLNSHRRNMLLFMAGNDRDKPKGGIMEESREALAELEDQLRNGEFL